ncbi:hypothetical protein ACWFRR_07535, partial [Streptomyces sp. NPDC055107]
MPLGPGVQGLQDDAIVQARNDARQRLMTGDTSPVTVAVDARLAIITAKNRLARAVNSAARIQMPHVAVAHQSGRSPCGGDRPERVDTRSDARTPLPAVVAAGRG